jgi:DNA polymerase III subunit gamma/tau
MSYEPLHHKYRPQKFADLVGQSAIATTLTNALLQKRIAPAYLLTGPRGTGKTSSARILAKSLNCLASAAPTPDPCGHCEVCISIARGTALDVIEIDAASNTGVDNIREIIERVQLAPVQARYKVYVIDECHMLSSAAFNALLKTLEEPPEGVVFVLATTDPQRVLPTIISRCQRFDYRRIPLQDMVQHLAKIAAIENINIDNSAINLVAQLSNGGLRDAESLLDQLSLLSGPVTVERVWDLVGVVSQDDLLFLISSIRNQQLESVLEKCRQLLDRGREPLIVLQNLANFYLSLLIAKSAPDRDDLVALTPNTWNLLKQEAKLWNQFDILQGQKMLKECEGQLKNTQQPRLWLEITLVGLLNPAAQPSIQPSSIVNQPTTTIQPIQEKIPEQQQTKYTEIKPEIKPEIKEIKNEVPVDLTQNDIWQEVLNNLSPPTTQSLVSQQCNLLRLEQDCAEIAVSSEQIYKYHQNKLNTLIAAFAKVCNRPIKVNFQIISNKKNQTNTSVVKETPTAISPPQQQEKPQPQVLTPENIQPLAELPSTKKAAETIAKLFEGEILS